MISTRDLAGFLEADLESVEHHIKRMVLSSGGCCSESGFLSAAESLSHEEAGIYLREVRARSIPYALSILDQVSRGLPLSHAIRKVHREDADDGYLIDVSL